MSKFTSIVAGVAVLPVLAFAGSVSAADVQTGQISGGPIYRAINSTKITNPATADWTDTVNATCGETVTFRVRIHNIGDYALKDVKVQATLPATSEVSHSSKVTVSASNSNMVTDTAGVKLDKAAKLQFVSGSTNLLDANKNKMSTLADGIVGGGVTLTDEQIGVSTEQERSVEFTAKVVCETTPPSTPEQPKTPGKEAPATLVKTGAGDVAAIIAAVVAVSAIAYNFVLRRQNAR